MKEQIIGICGLDVGADKPESMEVIDLLNKARVPVQAVPFEFLSRPVLDVDGVLYTGFEEIKERVEALQGLKEKYNL